MKHKARALSLLMALAMAVSMFAACGDGSGDPGTTGTDTGSTGGDKPKEVVTLKWWHWGDPPKNPDKVIEALNAKSAEDIGVKIDFIWATGDDAKLKTALSTGADDDIAFTCSWFANYITTAQKGQLYDITEMLEREEYSELRDFIPDWVWEGANIQGRLYAVPTFKDVASTNYWYCNKEYVFDQAGAEEEFMTPGNRNAVKTPLLKKLYDYMKEGHPYPHDLTAPYTYNFQGPRSPATDMLTGIDAPLSITEGDDTYTLVFSCTTPNFRADLKTLCEWYQAGYCNQDCLQLQKEPEFIIVNQAQGWEGAEKSVWGLNKDYTVAICQRGDTVATPVAALGSMQGIFANSKHPEEALKFIEYMNLDVDYRNMLGYGIEGENWEDNGDGTVNRLNSDWEPGLFAQGTFFTLKPVAPAPADMYDKLKIQMENAKTSPLLGFTPDYTNCKTEQAAVASTWEKYKYEAACGTMKDPDAFIDKVEKELNQVGLDVVKKEMQAQIDALLKSKGIDVPAR